MNKLLRTLGGDYEKQAGKKELVCSGGSILLFHCSAGNNGRQYLFSTE